MLQIILLLKARGSNVRQKIFLTWVRYLFLYVKGFGLLQRMNSVHRTNPDWTLAVSRILLCAAFTLFLGYIHARNITALPQGLTRMRIFREHMTLQRQKLVCNGGHRRRYGN